MKLVTIFFLTLTFAEILSIGCNDNKNSSKETKQQSVTTFDLSKAEKIIREQTNLFTEAHIKKDTAYLNNIFSQNANAYPPNSDVVTGRTAIATVNAEWVNYGIKEFTEVSTSFYGDENYLIDEGTYYLRYGENNTNDKGKYINIWKNENGKWKICSNIWNTSMPVKPTQ